MGDAQGSTYTRRHFMGRIVLPVYTPYYIPNGNEVAVIETSRGTIRVQLAGKDAPVTAGNFIELAARGF